MKKYLIFLMMAATIAMFGACSPEDENEPEKPGIETPETPGDGEDDTPENPDEPENPDDPGENPDTPEGNSKILVAYFSWGGTTQRMAQEIVNQTGADLFRIEPIVPYPTDYTECTEVAQEEKNNNARPAITGEVENWKQYDIVFIGCPVWWWTTPMIICTFAESYDFEGKTVVPFCTYASTYRDETLARIVELTSDADHLTGEGLTSGRINADNIGAWLREIGIVE
ncbi:flavodoxin [uncultured Bacteroides sp.]|uniref:flavodoxin n=1 Tax=uncultured Bacteroides sp. TaxID=162156 RepID=UPI00261BEF50|nr:flavodoxin [uncultured Bacteroides sp.]